MRKVLTRFATAALVATAAAGGLLWSEDLTPRGLSGFVSTAQAVIGRPVTPVSYAGVARRSVRTPVAGIGHIGVGRPIGIGIR
jgi:hypothetical protein